ncbi:hypothetical protein OLMES_3459 [Oleiphilus messinensis]|uniref:Outer membrane protein beta-barrel domain-containing protein n=1 Tax=Oleiphilus messinensis TaxID=141451 RepID=A0A1Y0IDD8_9GAMM|nr:outer membrane beta-barrel protein [Oleiphilus messinensis]ARU57495.1 hypothetical protein OLMES_3459 [Oleiphilus messinensis]
MILVRSFLLAISAFIISTTLTYAQEKAAEDTIAREGKDYVSVNAILFDYRSIGRDSQAQTFATSVTMGTYITDYVTVEVRGGYGLTTDSIVVGSFTEEVEGEVDENGDPATVRRNVNADVGLDYFFSWYIGLSYPMTEWMDFQLKYGFSHVQGKAKFNKELADDDIIADDYLTSTFSVSWLGEVDIRLTDNLWVTGEVGRLHSDTTTDIKTLHLTTGLKYFF